MSITNSKVKELWNLTMDKATKEIGPTTKNMEMVSTHGQMEIATEVNIKTEKETDSG